MKVYICAVPLNSVSFILMKMMMLLLAEGVLGVVLAEEVIVVVLADEVPVVLPWLDVHVGRRR